MNRADVIIIGGGLAGMTAALQLAKTGISTILFEKNNFPHHKVCGEYLSKEVLPYLDDLGIDLPALSPVQISRLFFSTSNGKVIESALPMGGVGISRFCLDNELYEKAMQAGARVIPSTVTQVNFKKNLFKITTENGQRYKANYVLAAYGKRSNLDKSLHRGFFKNPSPWLAVKSHYQNLDFPQDLVALHNFRGGYCGLSRTETGAVNVCYLATYKSFRSYKKTSIFEREVLQENPFLRSFFQDSIPLFEHPLTIAQVNFERKECVKDHILFLGDAAGLIHPLCGNGMAMAIHSAKIAAEVIQEQPQPTPNQRRSLETEYLNRWNLNFRRRITTGKLLQKILLNQRLSKITQQLISKVPFILPGIIKSTHGQPIL